MAINAIQSSTTFQAAESASDLALNNPSHLTSAYRNGKDNELNLQIEEVNTDLGMQSRSTLKFVGELGLVDGWSTGVGTQSFTGLLYVAQGVTAIPAVRSQSTVEQGAYRIVPK